MVKVIFFLLSLSSFSEAPFEPWGADASLSLNSQEKKYCEPTTVSTKICNSLICFYQNVISPIDGPRSNYEPSSSEYTRQAICKYGFFKGVALGCDRLLRENKAEWIYPVTETHRGARKVDPLR